MGLRKRFVNEGNYFVTAMISFSSSDALKVCVLDVDNKERNKKFQYKAIFFEIMQSVHNL